MSTFGPAYINLYGGQRGTDTQVLLFLSSFIHTSQIDPSNYGLSEGYTYRGRLLLSFRVEIEKHPGSRGLHYVNSKSCVALPKVVSGVLLKKTDCNFRALPAHQQISSFSVVFARRISYRASGVGKSCISNFPWVG